MVRKSKVNVLKDASVKETPFGYPSMPFGSKEEKSFFAGEYGRLFVEDGDDIEQNSISNQQIIVLHYLEEWEVIEQAHPAIVSDELYKKVQQVNHDELERRSKFKQRAEVGKDYRELFRGMVFCAECKSAMGPAKGCARPDAKTPSRIYYDCNGYRYSAHTQCSSHYVRQETLLDAVTDTLNQQVKVAVDVEQLIDQLKNMSKVSIFQNEAESRYASISARRKNMEAKMEQLLIDLTQRIIDRSEYDYMKKQYTKKYDELLQEENHFSCSDFEEIVEM